MAATMETQNQDHRQAPPPGEPFNPSPRTFHRRIDCAPSPRQPQTGAAPHGPGHGPGLREAA